MELEPSVKLVREQEWAQRGLSGCMEIRTLSTSAHGDITTKCVIAR